MRAGKKEGGLGEGIFARPPRRLGWESVSATQPSMLFQKQTNYVKENIKIGKIKTGNNCLEGWGQNRKIFVSLIEKNFGGAPLKNDEKIFLFCSPSGERKRWGGFLPVRTEMLAQKRFALRSVIATKFHLVGVVGVEPTITPTPRVHVTATLYPEH